MITILSKFFLARTKDHREAEVRRLYGLCCSVTGIFLNIVLFIIKLIAGILTASVAIMADGFNNLSDAGSSVISFVGILCAGKPSDKEHPFGHGRLEYVAGFVVSILIILLGLELFQDSVKKILHPEKVEINSLAVYILLISILIKVYMMYYNFSIGKKTGLSVLKATAYDSFSDVISTTVVLISICILKFTGKNMDGAAGVIVAMFVIYTGIQSARETISPLLGEKPDQEFIHKIHEIVMAHENVLGVHDIIVHDYGPAHRMISLHLEMPGEKNVFEMHDLVEHIEADLDRELSCESVIHMDPVEVDNKELERLKQEVVKTVQEFDNRLTLHDFRKFKMQTGGERLIFDVVMPQEFPYSAAQLKEMITEKLREKISMYEFSIKIEKDYV